MAKIKLDSGLYDRVKKAGNLNWTDDSGDGIQEPLLDVRDFDATLKATTAAESPPADSGDTGSTTTPTRGKGKNKNA